MVCSEAWREGPGPDLSAWLVVGYLLPVTLHSESPLPPLPTHTTPQYTSVSKIPLFIKTPVTFGLRLTQMTSFYLAHFFRALSPNAATFLQVMVKTSAQEF